MGYFSCKSESAITVCDPYNWDRKKKRKKKNLNKKIRRFSFSDLEFATGGFSSECFLGKGSHGSVYRAVLDDGKLVVAVKKTTTMATVNFSATFQDENNCTNSPVDNEIEILSKIRNPRLVNLLGFSLDSKEKKLIVVEFMENGSLFDLLHSNSRSPGWAKRLRFALQTAKAIETLHSSNPPIIHRDIKSSNILIDGNWNARLGDFGLALRGNVEDVRIKCTPPAGTLGYLDPGYVSPENLSTKSDVFSFGILLLEIISGRNAIDMNYSPPSVVDWALPIIKQGEFSSLFDPRISLPEDDSVMKRLPLLAARCVRSTTEKRPSMTEVVNCLKVIRERILSPIWNNLRRRMRKPSLLTGNEVFDTSEEVIKTSKNGSRTSLLKNRKVSSVQPGIDFGLESNRRVRSKSIGSVREIKFVSDSNLVINQLALVQKKSGLALRMPIVRLNKSKSMGMIQTSSLIHDSRKGLVFKLVENSSLREMDVSKLVISLDEDPQKKIHVRKQSM